MHNPRFTFYSPATTGDACALLSKMQGRAVIIAGGTDVVPRIKQRMVNPEAVVCLDRLHHLNHIEEKGGFISIGALTPLQEIERNERVRRYFPVLSKAARLIAGPAHRAMATIGGNICLENRCLYYNQSSAWCKSVEPCLKTGGTDCHVAKAGRRCHAVYSADLAPVLLLLDAEVVATGVSGERVILLSKFFVDDGLKANVLEVDEILISVRIPLPAVKFAADYVKVRPRKSVDFPVVGTAVMVREAGDSISIRLAFTGVASYPFVLDAGSFSKPFDKKKIFEHVGRLAYGKVRPVSKAGGSPAYKKHLARVSAVDGVEACLAGLGKSNSNSKNARMN